MWLNVTCIDSEDACDEDDENLGSDPREDLSRSTRGDNVVRAARCDQESNAAEIKPSARKWQINQDGL